MSDAEQAEANHRPGPWRSAFDCPRCGAFAQQDWEGLWVRSGKDGSENLEPPAPTAVPHPYSRDRWARAKCARCREISVWRDSTMVFPHAGVGGPPHINMPEEARELYQEASAVAAVSRRAGAALARATVERLLKVLDPDASPQANLDARISRIKPRVGAALGDMLDVVRVTGNGALHVDDIPNELVVIALDDDEGPALLELLLETANDLVDELITKPNTSSGLWAKLPAGVRARLRPDTNPT